MKQLALALCLWPVALSAQPLTMQYGGTALNVTVRDVQLMGKPYQIWATTIDGVAHFVVEQRVLNALMQRIEEQKAIIKRHEAVIANSEALLRKYETFANITQQHVALQTQMLDTTTALYEGYKTMYQNLERLMGMTTLSLLFTLGMVDPPGGGWQPTAGVGIALRTWQASVQVGQQYRGVQLGLRWPIGR